MTFYYKPHPHTLCMKYLIKGILFACLGIIINLKLLTWNYLLTIFLRGSCLRKNIYVVEQYFKILTIKYFDWSILVCTTLRIAQIAVNFPHVGTVKWNKCMICIFIKKSQTSILDLILVLLLISYFLENLFLKCILNFFLKLTFFSK